MDVASISPGISVRLPMAMRVAEPERDRAVGDFLDQVVFDQQLDALAQFVAARIEEASAGKEECGHGRLLNCVVDAMGQGLREVKEEVSPERDPR